MRTTNISRCGAFALSLAVVALAGCGGGGGGGSSTPPTPPSKVFFTDAGNGAIVSFSNATPTASFNIDRVITGNVTLLPSGGVLQIPSINLDAANNRLYVATQGNTFIYNNISTANGNVGPGVIMSATINTTGVNQGVSFWYNDLNHSNGNLYSVDGTGEVHVFDNPLNAPTVVSRVIKPDLGAITVPFTFGLALDVGKDMLYVGTDFSGGGGGSHIIVFNNPGGIGTAIPNTFPPTQTAVTPVAPSRILSFASAVGSFYLDTVHDRLYVSLATGVVLVFDNASTLVGTPTANRTINLTGGVAIQTYIFVDTSRDKLYAVAGGALGIIDNASTTNTDPPPGHFFSFSVANIALSAIAVAP